MAVNPAHEDLLTRILKTWETCDAEATASFYEEDAAYHLYPEVLQGRAAIRDSMAAWFTAFPDAQWELKNLMSSGDTFIAEGIFKGTHDGPMKTAEGEVPPTGKAVAVPCCFIGRVSESGLVAEDHTYFNAVMIMEQLGLA